MLEPDHRTLLSDALRPPPGMHLDRAVVTTFTLDLTTALTVPLAFAGARIADQPEPMQLLDAIRSSSDRIDIFYQGGTVSVPPGGSNLVALLEESVHPVRRPRPGHIFHPKVWALRFSDGDAAHRYRLLVSSRNLTPDRSWDVVLMLEGEPSSTIVAENEPLSRFIAALPSMAGEQLDEARADAVRALARDLRRVRWERPEGVKEIAFHPIGVRGIQAREPEWFFQGSRHLVISPFVTRSWIERVPWSSDATLISRSEELDKLPAEALDGLDVYALDADALLTSDEDGEQGDGASTLTGSLLHGLHAKAYWVHYGRRAYVLVGSANATEGAFGGNVEFLCELSGGRTALGIDNLLGGDAPFRQLLAAYQPVAQPEVDEAEEAGRSLDELLIDIAGIGFRANATEDGEAWRLEVQSALPIPQRSLPVTLSVRPFTVPAAATSIEPNEHVDVTFAQLPSSELTPFLVVHAETLAAGRRVTRAVVVQATLTGGPEHRVRDILVEQINTPEKFLRLLMLMLGLVQGAGAIAGEVFPGEGSGRWMLGSQGILELFAQTLATRPETLDGLAEIVERLQESPHADNVLPSGWNELWSEVWAARESLRATGEGTR